MVSPDAKLAAYNEAEARLKEVTLEIWRLVHDLRPDLWVRYEEADKAVRDLAKTTGVGLS